MLILVLAMKIVVIGLLFLDSGMQSPNPGGKSLLARAGSLLSSGTPAEAATGQGAGAPPALEIQTPDSGMNRVASPRAAASGPVPGGDNGGTPALPPIGARSSAPAANGNNLPAELEALTRRQEDLSRKEQELRVLEGELSKKLEQMQTLEGRIASMMRDAEGAQDAKYRHLVDVLSNMKAKQAASVLETLDPKIAVKVLAGMRGRQAGEVLTFVKPEKAAQLTEALARMQLPLD